MLSQVPRRGSTGSCSTNDDPGPQHPRAESCVRHDEHAELTSSTRSRSQSRTRWRHGIVHGSLGAATTERRAAMLCRSGGGFRTCSRSAPPNLNGASLLGCASVAAFSSRSSMRPRRRDRAGVFSIPELARSRFPDRSRPTPGAVVQNRYFPRIRHITGERGVMFRRGSRCSCRPAPSLTPGQREGIAQSGPASPLATSRSLGRRLGPSSTSTSAAYAFVPAGSTQNWSPASGTGSIEQGPAAASHVAMDGNRNWSASRMSWGSHGTALIGPRPRRRPPLGPTALGTGVEWTGSCFCTNTVVTTWTGEELDGEEAGRARAGTGKSWTGKSWTDDTWTGKKLDGGRAGPVRSWSGKSWTGKSWTGKSWTSS